MIESEAIKEATFKPVLCKVRPEMEERVKAVRETYDLRQEHLKSPSTEKNKEQARKDVAASKLRVQAFLERNNQKMEEREDRLFNLKLESEVQEIEEIERGQVPTNKRSDLLVKESVKYKGKDLIERQEMFLNAKEGKLEKRRREKEEQERIEDNKYSLKQTQKKKPATKARARLDQSAKTAEVSQHNISNNSLINEKSTTKAKADLKGKSGQTVEDFGKVLIEDDESEICINLLPDSNE